MSDKTRIGVIGGFLAAFCIGLLVFAFANFVSLAVRSDDPNDDIDPRNRYGFPFVCYECMQAGMGYYRPFLPQFSPKAMCADVAITLLACSLPAGIYAYAWRKAGHMTDHKGIVIQHENPAGMTKALMAIVHDGADATSAAKFLKRKTP